ncbi:MAG: type 1 glutamine amidotransferase domain-containing protein [Flavobacteriaceae bacterium]|nr:type 1 glutamine amidotransferase domain-containing protein [Flavobacteriaceae bacterium]
MKILSKSILVMLFIALSITSYSQKKEVKKVLFVVTSHDKLGDTGDKTGLWIEEFANPYYYMIDKGVEIDIASPKGGQAPIDPKSELADYQTEATKRFYKDKDTQSKLSKTLKLSKVKHDDYDAVFYPGGHGPLWDLAEDRNSIKLIESFYNNGKPVAFVCHAPAALKNVKNKNGQFLVKGKKVTSFTNSEELAVGLRDIVPFLVEDMLNKNGGNYVKGADWTAFAVEDGLLITGQNPQSSSLVAEKLFNKIN